MELIRKFLLSSLIAVVAPGSVTQARSRATRPTRPQNIHSTRHLSSQRAFPLAAPAPRATAASPAPCSRVIPLLRINR